VPSVCRLHLRLPYSAPQVSFYELEILEVRTEDDTLNIEDKRCFFCGG
jgi:hypothetical protein